MKRPGQYLVQQAFNALTKAPTEPGVPRSPLEPGRPTNPWSPRAPEVPGTPGAPYTIIECMLLYWRCTSLYLFVHCVQLRSSVCHNLWILIAVTYSRTSFSRRSLLSMYTRWSGHTLLSRWTNGTSVSTESTRTIFTNGTGRARGSNNTLRRQDRV